MEEIYRTCPEFENNDYILRMVSQEDRLDCLGLIFGATMKFEIWNCMDLRMLRNTCC